VSKPFVSVLIDTYNHERFIEAAVVSALEQDFPASEREIVVVDDGSTDSTREILGKFAGQARVLRKANGGQASAFNAGIPECRGEIIAFLDGDDWWAKEKLSKVVEVLARDGDCGVAGHGIVNTFEDGKETIDAPRQTERLRIDSVASARVFRLRKSYLGTSRMTLRKELAARVLPVPSALVIEADEYLFTMAAALSRLVVLPDVLTYYRQHGQNLYNAAGASEAGLRRKYAVHVALAGALRRELSAAGVPGDAVECVCVIIEAEAQQMRLMLDGGTPWETVRTENAIYRILHEDAPAAQRMFRAATMVAAGLLPPRWFYGIRRSLARNALYQRARRDLLAVPEITKVAERKESSA
jgi:hypothetical protein